MAISITYTDNTDFYTINGPGYYATTSTGADGFAGITRLAYLVGKAYVPKIVGETLHISNVPTLAYLGFEGGVQVVNLTQNPEREGEFFIRHLYALGVQIQSTAQNYSLDEQMSAGGKLTPVPIPGTSENHYDSFHIFDFLVLTRAIEYPLARLEFGDERPIVADAPKKDKTILFNTIRKLGIWGMCVHIYCEGGMTAQELTDCIKEWKPDLSDRAAYFGSYMVPTFIRKGVGLLKDEEKAILTP